ncbi:helix-turn-helix domain-containing protein [Actinoplanes sp. GCM10030250]|uniref:helix-turn-helix domain-containing protein n=1 Tax=Actinoplanes sp. GCM10030250 TaxID=3273376 RepID=UPI003614EAC6
MTTSQPTPATGQKPIPHLKYPKLTPTQYAMIRRKILNRHRNGAPLAAIARDVGRGTKFIRSVLTEAGVQIRKQRTAGPRLRPGSVAEKQAAARVGRMYSDDKKSIRTIAAELGVSYGTAHRLLHLSGVEIRNRGDWRRQPTSAAPREDR